MALRVFIRLLCGLLLTASAAQTYKPLAAFAAPIPLTSSSLFISQQRGLFRSALGFSLHAADSGWEQVPAPKDNSFIQTIYRAPNDSSTQAALTVRTDKMDKVYDVEQYAKKWMKDYPRFGFEILAAKKVRVSEDVAFMLDLVNRENSKQLRQVIFVKNKDAVTLTCRDDVSLFNETLKACNEIIRTFNW